jgi:hypothetical protein
MSLDGAVWEGEVHESNADVDRFLTRIAAEQTRFLDRLGDARLRLDSSAPELADVAARHARLTRQLLDAQRAIMRLRADVEVVVCEIAADAEAEVAAITGAARRLAIGDHPEPITRAPCFAPPQPDQLRPDPDENRSLARVFDLGPAPLGAPVRLAAPAVAPVERSRRNEMAEFGNVLLRTTPDVTSLAAVVDEAFAVDSTRGAVAERQLQMLLDEWWRAEMQEGRALVDDAQARAAMRIHLVRLEAGQLIEVEQPRPSEPTPQTLPMPIATALEHADHEQLEALLDSLLVLVSEPAVITSWPAPAPMPTAPAAPARVVAGIEPAVAEDAFDRFWGERPARTVAQSLVVDVLVPAATVVSLLALLLAWIG